MRKIKYLIMDVDGTLTDGKIYMGNGGELCKVFNIKDGCGIHDILIPAGIIPMIITGRSSAILKNRADELGIKDVFQGIKEKEVFLEQWIKKNMIEYSSVAYIGDDLNDLGCMNIIKYKGGIIGCPSDAAKEVLDIADYICIKKGGEGAVREFIEWIFSV